MKNWSIISLGFIGLLLLGAGCFTADIDDAMEGEEMAEEMMEEEDKMEDDGEEMASEVIEVRMINFRNSYVPNFNLQYDDNLYTVAVGEDALESEATDGSILVNNRDIWLFAEGGDSSERLLSMVYTEMSPISNETVEAGLGEITSSEDTLIGEIDARRHEMADGTTVYVILASTGYYQMTVHDQSMAVVAATLSF